MRQNHLSYPPLPTRPRIILQSFSFDYEQTVLFYGAYKKLKMNESTIDFLGDLSFRSLRRLLHPCKRQKQCLAVNLKSTKSERFGSDEIEIALLATLKVLRDLVVDWRSKLIVSVRLLQRIFLKAEFKKATKSFVKLQRLQKIRGWYRMYPLRLLCFRM